MARDHFAVFGLPRAYHLDMDDLERRYLRLQRETHPDRFVRALPRERLEAVLRSTELNDAYKVLKAPEARAEYLLRLEGHKIDDESRAGAALAEPQLLMEIMELREALAEAAEDATKRAALIADVAAKERAAWVTLDQGFSRYDGGDKGSLGAIAGAVVALRYYARFMEEAEGKDE